MNNIKAKLRIAEDVKPFAIDILKVFDDLPQDVVPDSISIPIPSPLIGFGQETTIYLSGIKE